MKNEKLIPSLIVEEKDSLPKRGGKYVSQKEKERLESMKKNIAECNCNCNCDCNCNCNHAEDHPFFDGEDC